MTLAPGTRLGPYEITAKLGEGGMGVVYRAKDFHLGREVALKVLPEGLTADPERTARFEREAKLLAQLNHPNIAQIHGLEVSSKTRALVMELVEGPTLAERLESGSLPLDESLSIARQIAEALEEAHERGVIHRDLKPQNLKASIEGKVKVLDFGLAKAMDPVGGTTPSASELALSPTITLGATALGVILGTAAYMAPEQARGLPVDKRADIWAFGVVLYEMLTGRTAFAAATVPDTLAAVLTREIDWGALPPSTPPAIRRLLRRCLERDPRNRLHDIADARIVLEEVRTGRGDEEALEASAAPKPAPRGRAALAAGALLLVAFGAFGAWLVQRSLRDGRSLSSTLAMRFAVRLPPEMPFLIGSVPGKSLAISRDGATIAYAYAGGDLDGPRLFVRRMDELAPRAIATVMGNPHQPFFSPDGAWIGYFRTDSLAKVSIGGGRPSVLVSELEGAAWLRGSWSDQGEIVFDTWDAGLRVVPAEGGAVRVLTEPTDEWHLGPEVIPGTRTVLFYSQSEEAFRVEAIGLDGGGRRTVLDNASQPQPLASGHLMFLRDGGLFAAPFDARTATVTGPAMPLAIEPMLDERRVAAPVPQVAVSATGTLVYAPAPATSPTELVWVDRTGERVPVTSLPFDRPTFDLSPDGRLLALAGRDGTRVRLSLVDMFRGSISPLREENLDIPTGPVFSADGREIYFARYGTHRGEVLAQPVAGGEPRLVGRLEGTWIAPTSVSRDGRWLVGGVYHTGTASDLWVIDLAADDPDRAASALVAEAGNQSGAALSPDGRWLAYIAWESNLPEVFLRRFPGGGTTTRVSTGGGNMPRWSPDGLELYFLSGYGKALMTVEVGGEAELELGVPRKLADGPFYEGNDTGPTFAVAPDGRRLLLQLRAESLVQSPELVVVQNWFPELARLFATAQR